MSKGIDLNTYDNRWFSPGAGKFKIVLWMIVSALAFNNSLAVINSLKIVLLRLFGATIGKGVTIKPSVTIKYPWNLTVGNHCWIGENVWIDNLVKVNIGNNCCISQGALLLTGNHNYKSPRFDLIVNEISLEDGVWIGAKAVVCPGITCFSHSVLTVSSVATRNLEAYGIYQGNPAQKIKIREIV